MRKAQSQVIVNHFFGSYLACAAPRPAARLKMHRKGITEHGSILRIPEKRADPVVRAMLDGIEEQEAKALGRLVSEIRGHNSVNTLLAGMSNTGGGMLESKELQRGLEQLERLTKKDIDCLMRIFDRNCDDKINLMEFQHVLLEYQTEKPVQHQQESLFFVTERVIHPLRGWGVVKAIANPANPMHPIVVQFSNGSVHKLLSQLGVKTDSAAECFLHNPAVRALLFAEAALLGPATHNS